MGLKRDEINNLNSCWNTVKDDEIVFVLKQTDPAMPKAIRDWVTERIRLGLNVWEDEKIQDAEECAIAVEVHQAHAALKKQVEKNPGNSPEETAR